MRPGSSLSSTIRAFNTTEPDPDDMVVGSPYCQMHRSEGLLTTKLITITGTGGEVVTNLFTVMCNCELKALYGIFEDVTDVDTVNGCYWDFWDGANSVALTLDGTNCSGAALKSFIGKMADDSQAAYFSNANQCRYAENATMNKAFYGGALTANDGATSYIRFRVDTDADTNCQIQFYCTWSCRCSGSYIEAV